MSHRPRSPDRIADRIAFARDHREAARHPGQPRAWAQLLLSALLALSAAAPLAVWAAEAHANDAAPAAATSAAEPSIRPNLKPDLKAGARGSEARTEGKAVRGEVKSEPKPEAKPEARSDAKPEKKAEPKAEAKADAKAEGKADTKPEAKAEAKSPDAKGPMSMAELRDVLDQKIAEVRSKQGAAPAVKVRARGGKAASASGPVAGRAAALADGAAAPAKVRGEWSYSGDTGPAHWASLKPEFSQCGKGQRQSPIDIHDGIPVELDPIAFDYRPTAFRVIDTGHTVQVNMAPGNRITVNGRRHELVQFHFHRPSEERLNGKQFDMVVHLEHKDIEGKLAVVAILISEGKGHPLVQQVWNNLPLEKFTEQPGLATIDLSQILPEQRQYVTYMGSQTTPPCQEGVLWMVMKQPVTASTEQMATFARLHPMNARPVQPTAGRLIKDGQ